jgi:hypothetical protein
MSEEIIEGMTTTLAMSVHEMMALRAAVASTIRVMRRRANESGQSYPAENRRIIDDLMAVEERLTVDFERLRREYTQLVEGHTHA